MELSTCDLYWQTGEYQDARGGTTQTLVSAKSPIFSILSRNKKRVYIKELQAK